MASGHAFHTPSLGIQLSTEQNGHVDSSTTGESYLTLPLLNSTQLNLLYLTLPYLYTPPQHVLLAEHVSSLPQNRAEDIAAQHSAAQRNNTLLYYTAHLSP